MERLTERIDDVPDGESGVWVKNHDYILAAEKLADYEDLEEQGRLLKLPCKVGDIVYIAETVLVEAMCIRIQLDGDRNGIWINAKEYPYDRRISFKAFGKTIFLTKSEAEAKLKELRGKNE